MGPNLTKPSNVCTGHAPEHEIVGVIWRKPVPTEVSSVSLLASMNSVKNVSGAWTAKKPLRAPTYFCKLRSVPTPRSAPLRRFSATPHRVNPLRPISARSAARSAPTVKFRLSRTNGGQINHAFIVKMCNALEIRIFHLQTWFSVVRCGPMWSDTVQCGN